MSEVKDTSYLERLPRDKDPMQARYLTSYQARRAYKEPVQKPGFIWGVADTIDIHCHAHDGQQDALAIAKLASISGMGGLLYKTLPGMFGKEFVPTDYVAGLKDQLQRWSDEAKVKPIRMWAGWGLGRGAARVEDSAPEARRQIEKGVAAVWMPIAMHANTLSKVGGRARAWDKNADPKYNTPPLSWDEAMRVGHYLLDERGQLKSAVKEIFRMIADHNIGLSFAHATHREIFAMAEEVQKLGIKKAFVDHPFSPFVDLDLAQMRQLTAAGITMNFTYDELSPLLGVDPARMANTIKALGTEYVTLSSDGGEPLFPNSIECMRLVVGHMRAFGLTEAQLRQASVDNPARIVGL